MSNADYLKLFKNQVDIIEQYGGSIGKDPAILALNKDYTNLIRPSKQETNKAMQHARDKYLAYALICCSNQNRYR